MTLRLTKEQLKKMEQLEVGEVMEIELNGVGGYITRSEYESNLTYKNKYYEVNYYMPQEIKIKKIKDSFIGCEFEPKKMHIYDVKTHGAHPVHLIRSGEYITEDTREFNNDNGDMGWFWLNTKEYNYYKSKARKIEIK